MNVDVFNTIRGRIAAHLICLTRSLWRGRFGSLGFFCAGIWRGVHDALHWHSGTNTLVAGHRVGGVRW